MSIIDKDRIDFIGLGTGKAGTSWLASMLSQHPQVDYPISHKEMHYFNPKIPLDYSTLNINHAKDNAWYHSHFDFNNGYKVRGEITPCYFDIEGTEAAIYKYNPEVKLFVILRNPIDRLISQFDFARLNGVETNSSLEKAVKANELKYANSSMYFKHLERYLNYFKQEQVKVLFYEDLKSNPESFFIEICKFLDIDQIVLPNLGDEVNQGGIAKNKLLAHLVGRIRILAHRSQNEQLINLIKKVKKLPVIKKALISNKVSKKKLNNRSDIDPDLKYYFLSLLNEDIEKLSKFTKRDLSHWLN